MILQPQQWLFIDTSVAGLCRVGILSEKTRTVREVKARSGALLPEIAKIGMKKLKTAKGICVVHGPGSFSSVRAGVLIANLLARLVGVPLIGITVKDAEDLDRVFDGLSRGTFPSQSFVEPTYDSEPNITVART